MRRRVQTIRVVEIGIALAEPSRTGTRIDAAREVA
jgi:hypothetical protein